MKSYGHFLTAITLALSLTACGGKSSDITDELNIKNVIFPDTLPAINDKLSTTTPEGIWMLVSDSEATYGPDTRRLHYKATSRQFIIITQGSDAVAISPCERNWFRDENYIRQAFDPGKKVQQITHYSEDGTLTETYQFLFSDDFNHLYGEVLDWNVDYYSDIGYENSLNTRHFYGVKISDSTKFENAEELTLIFNSDIPPDDDFNTGMLCLTARQITGTIMPSNSPLQAVETFYSSMNGRSGISSNDMYTTDDTGTHHTGGFSYSSSSLDFFDNFDCLSSEDCSSQSNLETNLYQSDKNGIHYGLSISVPDSSGSSSGIQLQPEISMQLNN